MASIKIQNLPESVGTIEVGGYECVVTLNSSGDFRLTYDGQSVGHGDTLDKAKKMARRELNKHKVKIHIVFLDNKWEKRSTTGFHQGMGEKAIVLGGRQTEYLDGRVRVWDPDIPAEERVRYIAAVLGIAERKKIKDAIEDKYKFELRAAIKAAERVALDQMEGEQ